MAVLAGFLIEKESSERRIYTMLYVINNATW
jgi:hypothetical protein